jgi:hypothetical protein
MTLAQVEKKLAMLEKEIEQLKLDRSTQGPSTGKWWIDGAGRFANDPVFDEIVRLGREYRESLRPKPRRRRKSRRADS